MFIRCLSLAGGYISWCWPIVVAGKLVRDWGKQMLVLQRMADHARIWGVIGLTVVLRSWGLKGDKGLAGETGSSGGEEQVLRTGTWTFVQLKYDSMVVDCCLTGVLADEKLSVPLNLIAGMSNGKFSIRSFLFLSRFHKKMLLVSRVCLKIFVVSTYCFFSRFY